MLKPRLTKPQLKTIRQAVIMKSLRKYAVAELKAISAMNHGPERTERARRLGEGSIGPIILGIVERAAQLPT